MRQVGEAESFRVLRDEQAQPRAILRPRSQAVYRDSYPGQTPVQIMSAAGFNPRTTYLIEGIPAPTDAAQLRAAGANAQAGAPADLEDLGPNAVRISATATEPSYLVLHDFYHRGWNAYVDGQRTPVLIADALFRAVPLEPGAHVVELRFEPLSHVVGAALSLASLLALVALLVWSFGLRRHPAA